MGEIVNLRMARKQKVRSAKEVEAEANRLKFGRSKAEKRLLLAETNRAEKHIDGHKRED
ncbi:DUF4169 family protein [Devosia chinhatensis]|uniref:DUF4169 family protein n=1 Tax=Devosia chinhatensis TaxID=429727 RepID=UPI0009FF3F2D|nr:DUF4169 family protein [Devosia chinhatensis]